MSSNGFVLVHRKARENGVIYSRPYCKFAAWIDLIMEANFSQGAAGNVELGRGELVTTERELASRWGWSKTKVHQFLQALRADGMISIKDQKKTKIKIENYERYQPVKFRLQPDFGPEIGPNSDSVLISTNQPIKKKKSTRAKALINPAEEDPVILEFPPAIDTPECRAKWAEYAAYRRAIKKPLPDYLPSLKGQLTIASKFGPGPFMAAIDATIASGTWTHLYPEKFVEGATPARAPRPHFGLTEAELQASREATAQRAAERRAKLGRAPR